MRFLDLLLCIGLFIMASFIFRLDFLDFRELRKQESKSSTSFDSPVPLQFVYGYDDHGQPISMLPLGKKRLAIFVIHGASFEADAAVWNSIAERNDSPDFGFVGVCDDQMCVDHLSRPHGAFRFSSVIYGDYLAMRTLLKADQSGEIEILNRATRAVKTFHRPQTSQDFAAIKAQIIKGQ